MLESRRLYAADITTNLVGRYTFDEGNGNTVVDAAGNADGTFVNSNAYVGSGAVGADAGEFDGDGSGSNRHVTVADNAAQDFGTGDFSVGLWYRADSAPSGFARLVGDFSGSGEGFVVFANGNNLTSQWAGESGTLVTTTPASYDGEWHHLLVSRFGDDINYYVDGVLDTSETGALSIGSVDTANPLLIGASSSTQSEFEGQLDDVRLYTRGLTAEDADALHATGDNEPSVAATIETAALAYTENDGAVAITDTITFSDVDDTELVSAAVEIRTGFTTGEDVLAFATQNGITGTYAIATGILSLTGTATLAEYETAIRSITYTNTSEDPDTTTRTVSFTVNDDKDDSNTLTRDIAITAVNDEEMLATNLGATVAEGSTGNVIASSALETTDVDNTADERVYTVGVIPVRGTLRRGGTALAVNDTFTQADLDAAIVTYDHDGSETSADAFDFIVDDGAGTTSSGTFNFSVTAINDAPVVTTPTSAYAFTEQGSLVVQGTGFAISDADDNGGTLTAIFTVGQGRVLIDPDPSGVTVSSGNRTDTVTFSGTEAQINALLDGTSGTITYLDDQTLASDAPSASTTITLTVNDQGNTGTDPGTSGNTSSEEGSASQTINVTAVNDVPTFLGSEQITNGDFNGGDLTDWTTTGTVDVNGGELRFGLGNAAGEHSALQTITTVAGETYTLSFDYRDASGTPNELNQALEVSVDGVGNLLTTEPILSDTQDQAFVRYTFTFSADSASSTIKFTDTSDNAGSMSSNTNNSDGHLDNISVKQTGGNLSTVSYTEDGTPTVLDSDLTVFDAETNAGLDDYLNASFTVARAEGADSEDRFIATGNLEFDGNRLRLSNTVVGFINKNDGGQLGVVFVFSAVSEAQLNEILQSIAYENISDTPPASVELEWSFQDGNFGSLQGTGGPQSGYGNTTVNITAVNDEEVIAINDGATVVEGSIGNAISPSALETTDGDHTAAQLVYTVDELPDHGTLRLDGTALTVDDTFTQADIDAGIVSYDHDGSEPATDRFDFTVDDGFGTKSTGTFNFTITPVNDAPVLGGTNPVLDGITEDDVNNTGITVSELIDRVGSDAVTDADGDPIGIAIHVNNGNGATWQYRLAGDSEWNDVGAVANNSSLLLTKSDSVRLLPNARRPDHRRTWRSGPGTRVPVRRVRNSRWCPPAARRPLVPG